MRPTLIQRLGRFNVPHFDFKVQSRRQALRFARGNRTVDDDAQLALTRSLSQRASFDELRSSGQGKAVGADRLSKYERRTLKCCYSSLESELTGYCSDHMYIS